MRPDDPRQGAVEVRTGVEAVDAEVRQGPLEPVMNDAGRPSALASTRRRYSNR